jgi:hypothetical protein
MYSGESNCQGKYADGRDCRELSRHSIEINKNITYLCGIHSKKYKDRTDLPKNPKAAEFRENLIKQRLEDAKNMAILTKNGDEQATQLPNVIATKIKMLKEYTFTPEFGYIPIYPNRKHSHGFGYGINCSGLSPMNLGPVKHNQEELPDSQCIENYHQFNKVFSCELSKELCTCERSKEWKHYKANDTFYKKRLEGYNDKEGHRHKYEIKEFKVNIPCYSIHIDSKGNERHYTYVESRYFYCKQMELLAQQHEHYKKLTNLLDQGYKLEILGYDAYRPKGYSVQQLYEHYCDSSVPFGHEMVILSLLTIENEEDFPWNKYHDEHYGIY